MARYRVDYDAYPGCPEATEQSRSCAVFLFYLGSLATVLSLAAIIAYSFILANIFTGFSWIDYSGAITLVAVSAILDYYVIYYKPIKNRCICRALAEKARMNDQNKAFIKFRCSELKKEYKNGVRIAAKKHVLNVLFIMAELSGIIIVIQIFCTPVIMKFWAFAILIGMGLLIWGWLVLKKRIH